MRYKLITEYLEETAANYPDKIAVVDEGSPLTFRELRSQALQIADALMEKGIFKKPVAVLMEKGAACLSAFLGVAYSGNFYTPIDSKMPLERAKKILDTLEPACLIVSESCREHFADIRQQNAFGTGEKNLGYLRAGLFDCQRILPGAFCGHYPAISCDFLRGNPAETGGL